ncbi:MAG: hypothetical protein LBG69_04105 [Zoogloeaceae bacterium]|jgi:predicted hotdog family 3-hydroxylacyl-ACP dehydratase|nr:hypothetical protein [Zoogloeaceae bacterium]
MPNRFLPLEAYLPHRSPMILLDRVLEAESGRIVCSVTPRADSQFCRNGVVPAYVGVEYMAQAVGALEGWTSRQSGGDVKIGFLVSVRKYSARIPGFSTGVTLIVEAREEYRDTAGLGIMDCVIYHQFPEVAVAEATLTVFQPHDLNSYLTESA